jgi:hypothetical protein
MTRFRPIHLVDAFQFDPQLAQQAPCVAYGHVPGFGECWYLVGEDRDHRHVLNRGDWVVVHQDGLVEAMADAQFRAAYEVASVDDVMRTRDDIAKITVELEATRARAKRLGIQLADATAELRTARLALNGFRKLEELRGVVPPKPNDDPPGTFRCAVCDKLTSPGTRPLKEVQNLDCACRAFARIGPCCRAALDNAPEEVDRALRASAHAKDCKNR